MTVDADALAARADELLRGPDGNAVLGRAVRAVLALDGAPTRPGADAGRLADRLVAGEPLAEDTDWQAPLGPFRDPHVVAGTLGELCAARLRSGGFAGDVLLALLAAALRERSTDLLGAALDEADADAACRSAMARHLGDELRLRRLAPLAAAGPLHPGVPTAG